MAERSLRRGEILGFTGLLAGAAGGYALGKATKNDALEAVLTVGGALAGVFGAHWFNTRPLTSALGPEAPAGIGDVPPPWRELYSPWWLLEGRPASRGEEQSAPWWPVMSRTVVVPAFVRSTWGAGRDWEYAGAANCGYELFGRFPRYVLYGGPMQRQHFPELKRRLADWAFGAKNLLGDGSPSYHACTIEVPINLPSGAVAFEWRWVWEASPSNRWQYVQPVVATAGRWERRAPVAGA